jgi:AcrR family transcriptional regulator
MRNDVADRRIRQTKAFLRQSLLELMKEKPVNHITVKDICLKADVNRGTFYAHYATPGDLLAQIENDLYEQIRHSLDKSLKNETLSVLLQEIFGSIKENGDLCRIIFSEFGDKEFLQKIINLARDRCLQEWKRYMTKEDPAQVERLYTYSAGGSVSVIQQWILGGFRESSQEIAAFVEKASNQGLRAFIS